MSKNKANQQRVEHVERTSGDILGENIARLKELFPEVVAEAKVDFDKLREMLSDEVDDRPERYSFTWAGKRDAIRLLQTPSRATLRPARKESVNFDDTQNLFIEGDNLEVLKLLYKSYAGRMKMIYIDPPYNTGGNFIYPDNFADPLDQYLQVTGQKDASGNILTSNMETSGRFHSTWLSMMYPRLFVARQLLSEDGVIFVSIDDTEVQNLKMILNEVFGEENYLAGVVWQKRTSPDTRATLGPAHDTIHVVARNMEGLKAVFNKLPLSAERTASYQSPDNDSRGPWASVDMTGMTGRATKDQFYTIVTPSGKKLRPPDGRCWALAEATFKRMRNEGRIWFGANGDSRPRIKRYLSEAEGLSAWTWWTNREVGHNQEAKKEFNDLMGTPDIFDHPKPVRLMRRMLELATNAEEDRYVLDFFAGSCSTAHAVLELNRQDGGSRRFLMVQLPEPTPKDSAARTAGYDTIAAIGKERIRLAIRRLKEESKGKLDLKDRQTPEDLGFKVFKLTESNYRQWTGVAEKDGDAAAKQMDMFTDPLLPGWKPVDVIYEVALKEGYALTCSIEELTGVKGNTIYRVTDRDRDQSFRICLDDKLKDSGVKALELGKDDLFICRDMALTDELAANLALQCNLKTI